MTVCHVGSGLEKGGDEAEKCEQTGRKGCRGLVRSVKMGSKVGKKRAKELKDRMLSLEVGPRV